MSASASEQNLTCENFLYVFESQPSRTRNPLVVTTLSFLTGQDCSDLRRTGHTDVSSNASKRLALASRPTSQLPLLLREVNTHYASLLVDPSRMTHQGVALTP